MLRLIVGVAMSWLFVLRPAAAAQTCAEPHYRWSEKVDTALATRPATATDVSAILTGWAPSHAALHGRCNTSLRALWELHPVYKVEAPTSP